MLHDLLLDIVTKGYISDLILVIIIMLSFICSWSVILTLGFNILKVKIRLVYRFLGGLLLSFVALFITPFIPIVAFFITLILPIILLKFYSKTKWIICCWVGFLLVLSSAIFPILFVNPLSSSNHTLALFFSKNRWSIPIVSLLEGFGAGLILALLRIYSIPIVPNPDKPTKSTDFVDSFIIFALLFWCYRSTIRIWESSTQFLIMPFIEWTVSTAAVIAVYIKKINDRKKDERKEQEIQAKDQEIQQLKESRIDLEKLTNFSNDLSGYVNSLNSFELPTIGDLPLNVKFTKREQDILRLIAQGHSNEEIAKTLYLNPDYVSNVIVAIRSKIGLTDRDRSKLVLYAIHWVNRNKKQ